MIHILRGIYGVGNVRWHAWMVRPVGVVLYYGPEDKKTTLPGSWRISFSPRTWITFHHDALPELCDA